MLNIERSTYAHLDVKNLTITQHGDTQMKKSVIVFLVLAGLSGTVQAFAKYECNRYVNGKYKGYIKINADNKKEAEWKAYEKYIKELRLEVDYVKCK